MSAQQYYNSSGPGQSAPQPYQPYPQQNYQPYPNNGGGYGPGPTMQPSAPYVEPQNQYVQSGPLSGGVDEKANQRFKPRRRLNDPIFLILFIATFAGFVVLSALSIRQFVKYNGGGGGFGNNGQGGTGLSTSLDYHTVYLLLVACALAFVLTTFYFMLVRAFTKIIMEITLALSVLLNIAVCVYYFVMRYWSGAIIFLVIALISIFSYWFMRKRIPLARILLQTIMDISKHHPSVYAVVIIGLIVQTAVNIWYTFTVVAIYVTWTPGNPSCSTNTCSGSRVAGLTVFATFAYLWTSQVVANVTLATLAGGTFGQWYYSGPGNHLKGSNAKAFVRATTTSLGSIAFGSLIVTLLELLRNLFQVISGQEAQSGDAIGAILACCASLCVSCISALVQYFNKYAYIEIALYGKSYIPAAKDTWRLLRQRGVDALVNDSLVGITLTTGSYIVGLLTALFSYLYLRYTRPSYNSDGDYTAPVILFGFLIGLNVGLTLASALEAGVSTIFVGLGEDPAVLAERSPGLFAEVQRNYPQVVNSV